MNKLNNRRTFAIISHPDAGKTTLTEKFLLYGGAIREAGSIKSKKSNKHAVSDWMEIEKQRGISVTSSVLQFNYNNHSINLLDTPGHEDFSEDTYRTLMAADSAVMIIDAAKGVEAQTIKLFKVCKMRGIPIFTFVNKMDRHGKDPLDLIDELEKVLGINSCPINWPIGSGKDFKGVFNRKEEKIILFEEGNHGQDILNTKTIPLNEFKDIVDDDLYQKLLDDIEMLDIAGDEYDLEKIQAGHLTPVYFGSALTNFGVEPFLDSFLTISMPPTGRDSNKGIIDPASDNFTGFIFKIQANMDKNHRDRISFLRICSGEFKKGMSVYHTRTNKSIRLAQPQQFVAQDRVIVESGFAGDIIGIHDPGIFKIGDTVSEKDKTLLYKGIPSFAPEHFARVSIKNSLKRKQFVKGIEQLSDEGSIQVFKKFFAGMEELIIGVVGMLQFDVLKFRLENEYNVEILIEPQAFRYIRWIDENTFDKDNFSLPMDTILVKDKDGKPVLLFKNEWSIKHATERNKDLILSETSFM